MSIHKPQAKFNAQQGGGFTLDFVLTQITVIVTSPGSLHGTCKIIFQFLLFVSNLFLVFLYKLLYNQKSQLQFLDQFFKMQKKKFEDMRQILQDRNYEVLKSVGKGAFGQVMLAKNKKTDKNSAIKFINKAQLKKKPFLKKYIDQQIQIMSKLHHPNIVFVQRYSAPDFIVIVMQYCETGNLLTYQAKLPGKTFTLNQALRVIVQVMKGLKCIHQKDFVHRDIKSQNVLLKKNEKNSQILYKIADFGFARSIGGGAAKTHCGTQKYMAPQILSNSYYGISVDIWALGVLFYFMLFAQYPFKGHDMKSQITRRCTPYFNLSNTVGKKQKLKDINSDVQDFFKKIFVVDSKKRMTFANIAKHALFVDLAKQFQANKDFYDKIQKKGQVFKDQVVSDQYGFDNQMQPQDDTRAQLLKKKRIGSQYKHIQRQLQEIKFQIDKVYYLRECAYQLFDNYSSYLSYAQRLATKFYLLKAYLFYADPLLKDLQNGKIPQSLQEAGIDHNKWNQCLNSKDYKKYLSKLQEENMKIHLNFEDTYNQVGRILQHMPIKNFEKGYKLEITERNFDELKFAYRSTTSYIFKSIHQNKKIDPHVRNKIKMRLFCCHMVNRIFNRKQVLDHFPFFIQWLKKNKIQYPYTFDFLYFKRWIYEQIQENLQRNIALLHKTFF